MEGTTSAIATENEMEVASDISRMNEEDSGSEELISGSAQTDLVFNFADLAQVMDRYALDAFFFLFPVCIQ